MANLLKLATMKAKSEGLIRTKWHPENAPEGMQFKAQLRYIAPTDLIEIEKQWRTRRSRDGKPVEDMPQYEFVKQRGYEVLLHAVLKCEGVTFRKLRTLIPLLPEEVAKAGGLDVEVPMDPSLPGPYGATGRENLIALLEGSEAFMQWALMTCSTLANFQDGNWEEQAKNSDGQGLNSAATLSSDSTANQA